MKGDKKRTALTVIVDVLSSFDGGRWLSLTREGGEAAEFLNVRELWKRCEYETLLIENVSAVLVCVIPCIIYS